jgi:DNA-binding NarL/FixJ family response regulator
VTDAADRPPAVRVFLCDDAASFRFLLRHLVEEDPRLEVVGEAADGDEGVAGVTAAQPDLVLVDLSMPRVGGLEAIPQMLRAAPGARVIALSGFPSDRMARDAVAAGAAAYLVKDADVSAMLDAIREVAGLPPLEA